MQLYKLANEYKKFLDLAEAGELDAQTIKDTMEALNDEFAVKAENCLMIVKQLERDSAGYQAEISRMKALQEQADKSAESLKDYVKECMASAGHDKLDLKLFKLTLKKATKAVEIVDTALIPADYWRVIPETKAVDKALISTMLKLEKDVPGAKLVDGKRALLIK